MLPLEAMRLAIEEAKKGAGFVAPNPLVGCVILNKKSEIIGKGYHAQWGGDHAEVAALKSVVDQAQLKDATMLVTLEPCAHQGRTPPCADRLAQLPLKKVIYGMCDPNLKVNGKGLEKLRSAGIEVETLPELKNELEELAEIFFTNVKEQRAFVAVKVAVSSDGYVAHPKREEKWLSGEVSREYVQYLRGCADAIMVGKNTLLQDNPRLNIRHPQFSQKRYFVFIVDPQGETIKNFAQYELAKWHEPEKVIWLVDKAAKVSPSQDKIKVWSVPTLSNGSLDFQFVFKQALAQNLASVLVEGGPHLISSLIEQELVDRWHQFQAPVLLGQGGLPVLTKSAAQKLRLKQSTQRLSGEDVYLTGRVDK